MKKTLLITTLIAASAVSVMADTARLDMVGKGREGYIQELNNDGFNTGWTYVSVQEHVYGTSVDGAWYGQSISHDGTHNRANLEHKRANMSIDLSLNARYEFSFTYTLSQAGASAGNFGMGGIYLAGTNKSLYFGNQLDSTWDKDTAVVLRYSGDIAEYNDDYNPNIYFPNHELSSIGAPNNLIYPDNGALWTVFDNNQFNSGNYKLEIVIESFADASRPDMVYFFVETPDGTAAKHGEAWTMDALGFGNNAYFDAYGFVLHDDVNSTATPGTATANEYSRVKREVVPSTPTPEPSDPNLPEPSAFGLLAGLGAIALATSRRRRK